MNDLEKYVKNNQQPTIEQNHGNFRAHKQLGDALSQLGQQEKEIAAYTEAIKLEENSAIYFRLGNAQRKDGDAKRATVSYQKAIELNSQQPFCNLSLVYRALGETLREQGKLDEAIIAFSEAIKLEPKNAVNHIRLGSTKLKKEDREGAIASYQQAIKLNPKQPFWVYKNLGDVLEKNARVEEAIVAYGKAIKLKPDASKLYLRLAQLYSQKGQINKGIEKYPNLIDKISR